MVALGVKKKNLKIEGISLIKIKKPLLLVLKSLFIQLFIRFNPSILLKYPCIRSKKLVYKS